MKLKFKNSAVHENYRQITTCTGYQLKDDFAGMPITGRQLIASLLVAALLAIGLWCVPQLPSWLSLSVTGGVLALLALVWGGTPVARRQFDPQALITGLGSALLLVLAFWLCKLACTHFALVTLQLPIINAKPLVLLPIGLLLVLVISPCLEIFWRGFIQRGLMQSLGSTQGLLLSALLYTASMLPIRSVPLLLAALLGGLLWGYLYTRDHHIATCIISHSLYTLGVLLIVFFGI